MQMLCYDKLNLWPFQLTFKCDLDLQPTWTNISNDTSTPEGKQLSQIILQSMHKCTSYGPDKSGQMPTHAHIHQTEAVTTMSCSPQVGLSKKEQCSCALYLWKMWLLLTYKGFSLEQLDPDGYYHCIHLYSPKSIWSWVNFQCQEVLQFGW